MLYVFILRFPLSLPAEGHKISFPKRALEESAAQNKLISLASRPFFLSPLSLRCHIQHFFYESLLIRCHDDTRVTHKPAQRKTHKKNFFFLHSVLSSTAANPSKPREWREREREKRKKIINFFLSLRCVSSLFCVCVISEKARAQHSFSYRECMAVVYIHTF